MADEPPPELTEAQQAKLAAKQFKGESRKLAKALKGKKPDPKLEAVGRCRQDFQGAVEFGVREVVRGHHND